MCRRTVSPPSTFLYFFNSLSEGDIIRARIRTTGVDEHNFVVEKGSYMNTIPQVSTNSLFFYFFNVTGGDANTEFFIADVGGSRNQVRTRLHFYAFFYPTYIHMLSSAHPGRPSLMMVYIGTRRSIHFPENWKILITVQAILFLAPLAFNQALSEDPKVNRLVGSRFQPLISSCWYWSLILFLFLRRIVSNCGKIFALTSYLPMRILFFFSTRWGLLSIDSLLYLINNWRSEGYFGGDASVWRFGEDLRSGIRRPSKWCTNSYKLYVFRRPISTFFDSSLCNFLDFKEKFRIGHVNASPQNSSDIVLVYWQRGILI